MMFSGKVMASAIGVYKPGFASGIAIFIAAGTAMYEALATKTVNRSLSPLGTSNIPVKYAVSVPRMSGVMSAKMMGMGPFAHRPLICFPL
jgi:hypothetical protein